jgi:hypothetical protein
LVPQRTQNATQAAGLAVFIRYKLHHAEKMGRVTAQADFNVSTSSVSTTVVPFLLVPFGGEFDHQLFDEDSVRSFADPHRTPEGAPQDERVSKHDPQKTEEQLERPELGTAALFKGVVLP